MTALLLTATLSAWTAAQARQAPPRIVSPEVGADRRVTFRLLAPGAREVIVSGEFMPGSTAMQKTDDGVWSVTVGPLEPEIYHYTFSIDGVKTIDPGNAAVKTGANASTLASILEVRGPTPAFYDVQAVPHGDVRSHWYASKSLDSIRRLTVYTPPGYDRDLKTVYPVLYLLHGANADETAWHRLGRANHILDNLLAAGRIKPFLVVMPFGYGIPPGASEGQGQNTARFGKDLIEDVIPYVQAHFRTSSGRDSRAIAGLSMGGGQALTIGLTHLDLFSHVGGFSSGFGTTDFVEAYGPATSNPERANQQLRLLWIGCGKEDGAFAASDRLSKFLTERRIVHTFRATDGAHTWMVWRKYLFEISPLLFK
jgi:enterochelin esterase-like enzyme